MKTNKLKSRKREIDENISFLTPHMTADQNKENLLAFGVSRREARKNTSTDDKLKLRFLRLKFQIDNFLNSEYSGY